MACSACSRVLPEGARFCPFCGHQVAATIAEERRLVTVLFADIVGYTSLVEHLDPEQAKRLLDGAFECLIADIVSFGGTIDKILGDGVLALFGAPVTNEDDPDRAVRAALQCIARWQISVWNNASWPDPSSCGWASIPVRCSLVESVAPTTTP